MKRLSVINKTSGKMTLDKQDKFFYHIFLDRRNVGTVNYDKDRKGWWVEILDSHVNNPSGSSELWTLTEVKQELNKHLRKVYDTIVKNRKDDKSKEDVQAWKDMEKGKIILLHLLKDGDTVEVWFKGEIVETLNKRQVRNKVFDLEDQFDADVKWVDEK